MLISTITIVGHLLNLRYLYNLDWVLVNAKSMSITTAICLFLLALLVRYYQIHLYQSYRDELAKTIQTYKDDLMKSAKISKEELALAASVALVAMLHAAKTSKDELATAAAAALVTLSEAEAAAVVARSIDNDKISNDQLIKATEIASAMLSDAVKIDNFIRVNAIIKP